MRKLQDQLALKHALVRKRDLKSIVLDHSMNKTMLKRFTFIQAQNLLNQQMLLHRRKVNEYRDVSSRELGLIRGFQSRGECKEMVFDKIIK